MKIPAKAIVLLVLPFFLNDLAVVFLKLAVMPTESLAYFYHKMPWIGETLVAWQPASLAISPYRLPLLWGQDLIVFVAIPAVFFFVFFKKQLLDRKSLGLGSLPSLWDCGYSLILALQLFLVAKFIRYVLLEIHPPLEIFGWFNYDFPPSFPWQILTILYACVSAAVVEELIFRGLLIPWLQSRGWNTWAAILISAFLFAGIHWCQGPVQLASTFVFGLITGITFSSSGKLWPLILAHFFINLAAFWPSS